MIKIKMRTDTLRIRHAGHYPGTNSMKPAFHFLIALAALPLAARGEIQPAIDFNRDIRPIFSENCFTCHGPDTNKREAGLRLDEKASAFAKAESGEIPIVPGEPEKSEVIRRLTTADKDDMMPPRKEHKRPKPAQVELLRRWIKAGAKWEGHWAFQPVKAAAVPESQKAKGERLTPIDAFIAARLEREGLWFSPEAEKAVLIRRVSLALTGLPPSLTQVDDFLKDAAPNAYEKVIDRLLASPHFGERLAVPWLDLARYGDTSGYHNDSLRDMWLWREWVIKAFNANMPFSQFTIEQLAGDVLPGATIDQQIASGFHRNVMTSDEGGLIDEEYLNLYVVDRVATTGVAWLGLTVACAQCHDHKYDPIKQREFYQLYSFFNNVPESGKDGVRDRNPKPFLSVPSPEQKTQLAKFDSDLAAAHKAEQEAARTLDARQAEWEKKAGNTKQPTEPAGPWVKFPLDADGGGLSDSGQKIEGALKGESTFTEGAVEKSLRVEAKGWIEYGEKFGFERDQPFTAAAWLRLKPQGGSPFGKMEHGGATRGWDVEFHGTKPSFHLIHQWPNNAIHVQAEADLPADTFLHFAVSYDGSGKGAGVKMLVNGVAVKTAIRVDTLTDTIKTDAPFSIGRRGSAGQTFTGRVDDLRIYGRPLTGTEIEVVALGASPTLKMLAIPAAQRTKEQSAQIQKYFRETQAKDYAAALKAITDLEKERTEFQKAVPNTMVMSEMEKVRDTFIKVRGNYDQNGEKVSPAAPAFLPALAAQPADGKRYTRLDLARWLVSPEQPLTARVTVNRFWKMVFGTGLVKTVNDFGAQGEWPSHPELLDWLAADFMRDWDVKRALKQMAMSATYRQSARVTPQLLEKDSENRLLARGPRQRLDAEFLRDNALAVAGILNPQLGGKSIKPAQPAGTWEINEMGGQNYVQTKGAEQYRRGLYVYWRRSTVYPSFITLDAPTREFCSAQRARTSTPLQSLVLMNDPVFVEAARAFAQRILTHGGADDAQRLRYAWRTALSRSPSESETAILGKTLATQLATYAADKPAAAALVKVGDLEKPPALDDSQLAAWTAVANVLLNLNETISD